MTAGKAMSPTRCRLKWVCIHVMTMFLLCWLAISTTHKQTTGNFLLFINSNGVVSGWITCEHEWGGSQSLSGYVVASKCIIGDMKRRIWEGMG